jgi:uncharacterized membrane protein
LIVVEDVEKGKSMPPLHPLIVHFPIALIIVAAAFEMIAWFSNKVALHRAALVNLIAATVMAVPVILAGLAAEDAVFTADPAHDVLEIHEALAFISLGILFLLSVWAIIGYKRWDDRAPVLFLIGLLIAAGSIGATGYFGGELVFKHGVAVSKESLQTATGDLMSAANGYRCPVHRDITSSKPGLCPKCGVRMIPILNLPTHKDVKQHQADAQHD